MLTGYKKKLVKETISYYIDTTGLSSEKFIQSVISHNTSRNLNNLDYKDWLAVMSFKMFQEYDISLADCLEFRNLATQLKLEKKGMNVTPIWKKEIAKCIQDTDISKYTLLELSEINSELKYIDSLQKEINYLKKDEDKTFYNTNDFDENNKYLFNLFPKNIQNAIINNSPIFINVNPYLEHDKNIDIVIDEMRLFGFNKKYVTNIFYASLFKLVRFCENYNLTNVRIGFFSPLDMFYEKEELSSFYSYFKKIFSFNSGICFSPKSVGVKDSAPLIGYSIWDVKLNSKSVSVVLKEKIQHTDDTILDGSFRLFRGKRDSLYSWETNSISLEGDYLTIPTYLNIQTKSDVTTNRYSNVICYQANTSSLYRSCKRVGVYSVPVGECTPITNENFYKSVASYVVRSCISEDITKPIYLSNPDTGVEGYTSWLADAVIYFLFSSTNMTKSYREKDFYLPNKLFPLSFRDVRKFVTDINIINDMNSYAADNLNFIQILNTIHSDLSPNALDLYSFGKRKIIDSLLGKVREDYGYKDSLVAWDASFYQIRQIDNLFTPKEEELYSYMLSKLRASLYDGVYKYGFISEIE